MGSKSHTPTMFVPMAHSQWTRKKMDHWTTHLKYKQHDLQTQPTISRRFPRGQVNNDKLHQCPNNLHIPQTKDSPIKTPHLTLVIQHCKLDKNMITSQLMIRLLQEEARIYDHVGTYVFNNPALMTHMAIGTSHSKLNQSTTSHPTTFPMIDMSPYYHCYNCTTPQ